MKRLFSIQRITLLLFADVWIKILRHKLAILAMAGKNVEANENKIWVCKFALQVVEHKADVVRLQLMLEVGGMYMDTDSVILKSLDKFRNEELTLGQATPKSVGERWQKKHHITYVKAVSLLAFPFRTRHSTFHHSRSRGGRGPFNPIFSIPGHFMLWEAVSQIKYHCSPKVKIFSPKISPPPVLGWLRHWFPFHFYTGTTDVVYKVFASVDIGWSV